MPFEKSERGFQFQVPKSFSDPIFHTGNSTMGGEQGSLGLVDPQSQTTTLVAKINHQFVGVFQAGLEWGKSRGFLVEGESDPGNSVHAEEYLIAALQDVWSDLTEGGVVSDDVTPTLTVKITKSPCPGCTKQLIAFAREYDLDIRIKAAQLWRRNSGGGDDSLLAIQDLAKAGIVVMPWNVVAKAGKQRKQAYGGGEHELGKLKIAEVNEEKLKLLSAEFAALCEVLDVKAEDKFKALQQSYREKTVVLDEEELLKKAKQLHESALQQTMKKLEAEQVKINKMEEFLAPRRHSSRKSTKLVTKKVHVKMKQQIQQRLTLSERLEQKKERHETVLHTMGDE